MFKKRFYISCYFSMSLFLLIFLFVYGCSLHAKEYKIPKYAIAVINTPVLNTDDFESVFGGKGGKSVKTDNKGLIREMEFIALPNTVFEVLEETVKADHSIYRIRTDDYPYNSAGLFIDSRFVKTLDTLPENRVKNIPSREEIISAMNSLEGYQYMWGGNCGDGIEQLLEFYKPSDEISNSTRDNWMLKGVDCSGLIYQTTNGSTPRNTSSLITYGEGVDIAGMNAGQIAELLQPLDLIVWSGHVIIVIDQNTVIESTPDQGVHKSNLFLRLKSILKERTPVNDWGSSDRKRFVVRRWYLIN